MDSFWYWFLPRSRVPTAQAEDVDKLFAVGGEALLRSVFLYGTVSLEEAHGRRTAAKPKRRRVNK